jgi:uncharacterized protein (TIGR03085 family)
MPMGVAKDERAALCDLFTELGPDQPTLCDGWQTRDLAAHLVIRERRPDAAAGIVLRPLAGHTARVQAAVAARPFDQIVAAIRNPPAWSPLSAIGVLDRATNTTEFFIHHEDARRAQPDWQPRPLPEAQSRALWKRVRLTARQALRRLPASVLVDAPGYGQFRLGTGPELRLAGDPGELTMFLSGRQAASRVELTGPDELVTRLRGARLGV